MKARGVLDPTGLKLDWNHVYLLAWYDDNDNPYLTTWMDTDETIENYIHVVVVGPEVHKWGPPIWGAPATAKPNNFGIPSFPVEEFTLYGVKPEEDWKQKARELGGVRALGWYFEKGFERKWHEEKQE